MIEKYIPFDCSVRDRWQGKYIRWRIGNRIAGGLASALGIIVAETDTSFGYIGATIMLAEGLGDLITGKHHYATTKLGRLVTGDKNWPHKLEDISSN